MPFKMHEDKLWNCGACGKQFRKVEKAIEHEEKEHGGLQVVSTATAMGRLQAQVSHWAKIKGAAKAIYFLIRYRG